MKTYNNAFELLTSDPIALDNYMERSSTMDMINDYIRNKGWSQVYAAKYLSVTPERIEDLQNGRISEFERDDLMDMLLKFAPQYKHALVIGKLMNPHVGHRALIQHAIDLAEKTTLLICATAEDRMDSEVRLSWLRETFENTTSITIDILNYIEEGLEGGEVSDVNISANWTNWILDQNRKDGGRYAGLDSIDVLVGSEDYIQYMADASGGAFEAAIFDQDRVAFPCSSTGVNNGDFDNYLPVCKRDILRHPNYGQTGQ